MSVDESAVSGTEPSSASQENTSSSSTAPSYSFDRFDNWQGWNIHSAFVKARLKAIFEMPEWSKSIPNVDPNHRVQLHALSGIFGLDSVSVGDEINRTITITKPANWKPPPVLPVSTPLVNFRRLEATIANAPTSEVFTKYYESWNGWKARKPEIKAVFQYYFAKLSSRENVDNRFDSAIISGLGKAQLHEVRQTTEPLGLIFRNTGITGEVIIDKPYGFEYEKPDYAKRLLTLAAKRNKNKNPERTSKTSDLEAVLTDTECERCHKDGCHCVLVMGYRFKAGRGVICSDCWNEDPYLRGHKKDIYEDAYLQGVFVDDDWF